MFYFYLRHERCIYKAKLVFHTLEILNQSVWVFIYNVYFEIYCAYSVFKNTLFLFSSSFGYKSVFKKKNSIFLI